MTAESDPIEVDEASPSGGFLSRLNPKRLFSRRNPEFYIREGKELLETQSYAQAMVAFKRALEIDPDNTAAFRGLGKIFFKKGGRSNMTTALNYYQEAIRRKPMDHELYAISAKIYDSMKMRKEATLERKKFVIVRALDQDPKNPVANNNMGILFLQQGKAETAVSYFQKAIDSDKNYDVAHRNMAAVYMRMAKDTGDADKKEKYSSKAREEIKKAVDISPTPPSLLAYARILLKEGTFDEVLRICDQVDEMEPASKHVYQLKKLALEGLGRFEEARIAHESFLAFAAAEREGPEPEAGEE